LIRLAITVKLVGSLRHFSGSGELELGYSHCPSVGDLVDELTKAVPEMERSLIDRQLEDPTPNALILVNGREIGVLDGLETRLRDGDEVVLVPVVHGG
jgi:molybdopterin synthase sulfur carrier subunit